MLPIIFNESDPDKQEVFIEQYIKDNNYTTYSIFRVVPLKIEISIDQIRTIKKEIITATPYKRLFIVYKFDSASLEAQNAFLKTLEERNESNQFILLAADIGRVLPTILSRSKRIDGVKSKETEINESVSALLSSLGKPADYGFLGPVTSITREDAIKFFDHSIVVLRALLPAGKVQTTNLLKSVLKQRKLLLNNNLNPQLAVDWFLLTANKVSQK